MIPFKQNQRGIALLTALMLTLISLGIIMVALYFVTRGAELSSANKRYRTSLEAAHGATDVFAKQVIPLAFDTTGTASDIEDPFTSLDLDAPDLDCFKQKVSLLPTGWSNCTMTDLMEPSQNPDATFVLRGLAGQPDFRIYAKIVDTIPGNTATGFSAKLDAGAATTGSPNGGITPMHAPTIYRIEMQGERENNPQERAELSVLYAY